ncbi:MAG: hypothetical protein ACRD4E_09270 [Bryobacteraceae bacterium]
MQERDKLAVRISATNGEEWDCIGMSQTIKAVALSLIFAVPTTAGAAPPVNCTQAVQNAKDLAATIASSTGNYWTHRQKFVDYKFGKSRHVVNALTLATREQSVADPIRRTVTNSLVSFQAAIATVRAQNCLSAAASQAIVEPATTLARKVNFDQLPAEETEATGPGPKKMPP